MIAVGLTDLDWFAALRDGPAWQEINFWTPTPWRVKRLSPGDLWYFLLKAPVRKIGGWGNFFSYEEVTVSTAWDRFGPANGVPSRDALLDKITGYADRRALPRSSTLDPVIGCIVLRDPVLLEESDMLAPEALGAPVPRPVVKYKQFSALERLEIGTRSLLTPSPFDLVEESSKLRREGWVVDRPGQRHFRDQVLRAYGFACAITGETCREVLQAAHIQPYVDERSDDVRNGLSLRSDLHALFDAGLLSVDYSFRVQVSPRLQSPAYRALHGHALVLPSQLNLRPSETALAYHWEHVFRGS